MTLAMLSEQIGNAVILTFLVGIPLYAHFRKVPVYDQFIEGAKEGFPTFLKIVPFMVGMIVAIGMLRASGAFDLLGTLLSPLLGKIGIPAELVPIALVRPFSAAAATAATADIAQHLGGDAFITHLSAVVTYSAETTFYIVAIYFGAAGIRHMRHAVLTGVIVDLVGMLSAIWLGRIFLS